MAEIAEASAATSRSGGVDSSRTSRLARTSRRPCGGGRPGPHCRGDRGYGQTRTARYARPADEADPAPSEMAGAAHEAERELAERHRRAALPDRQVAGGESELPGRVGELDRRGV